MEKVIAIIDMLTEGNRLILLGLWIFGHCLIILTFIVRARNPHPPTRSLLVVVGGRSSASGHFLFFAKDDPIQKVIQDVFYF